MNGGFSSEDVLDEAEEALQSGLTMFMASLGALQYGDVSSFLSCTHMFNSMRVQHASPIHELACDIRRLRRCLTVVHFFFFIFIM